MTKLTAGQQHIWRQKVAIDKMLKLGLALVRDQVERRLRPGETIPSAAKIAYVPHDRIIKRMGLWISFQGCPVDNVELFNAVFLLDSGAGL